MKGTYIVDGLRTPIGGLGQSLKDISAVDLGSLVIKGLLKKQNLDGALVDEVIMGNVVGAGLGQNPSRQSLVKAGLPLSVPGFTINKVCGSGLKSVILAAQAIFCKDADIIIAGGMESASGCPRLFSRSKKLPELKKEDIADSLFHDGLWCRLDNRYMGAIAEYTVEKFKISRQDQDRYAFGSHQRACQANRDNLFQEEIVPVSFNGKSILSSDEKPRENITTERLASLPPAFVPEGTVTAGNSSAPADGGAALILSSEEGLKKTGIKPAAEIIGYAITTLEPDLVFTASASAIEKCLKVCSLKISDVDIFEVNESFSVQALVTIQLTGLDPQRLNIFGGTIALGHPLGVSGARGLVTLVNVLKNQKKKIGITSVCLGGGSAIALAVRMI